MDEKNKESADSYDALLIQVKEYADDMKKMHTDMQLMLEECKNIKSDFEAIQQEKVQAKMLKLASKAARKAAKKSIAKAQIKERLYQQGINKDSEG